MIVHRGYTGWWAETEKAETKPAILMRKDLAKKWAAELMVAAEWTVKPRSR